MEAALGVISCSVPSFSGAARIDAYCHPNNAAPAPAGSARSSSPSSIVGVGFGLRRSLYCKTRKSFGFSRCEFRQNDHLEYYSSGGKITCGGGGGGGKKEIKTAKKMMKRRLKMLEGLSRDLSMFSSDGMDFGFADNALFDPVKAKMIAEAAELLQGQLKQLMTEDKESRIWAKAEKIRLKMHNPTECEELSSSSMSSSSSSESSDDECGEVVDFSTQNILKRVPIIEHESLALPGLSMEERIATNSQAPFPEALSAIPRTATQKLNSTTGECTEIPNSWSLDQGSCAGTGNFSRDYLDNLSSPDADKGLVAGVSTKKIEVCMGGKCKRSGAAALLGEFQRRVGTEGAVSGCKCMGKCRDGPNVRIIDDPVKSATDSLCIGVGLEEVGLIVANFIGKSSEVGLAVAS